MIELKITGYTVEEFFESWNHLLRHPGVPAPASEDIVEKQPEPPVNKVPTYTVSPENAHIVLQAVGEPVVTPPVTEAPKGKRGRPKKETQPILDSVQAASPKEVPSDPIPDFLKREPDNTVKAAKEFTLDDIRDRVRRIIDAHTKRGHDMPIVVLYVQHLFKPFGIAKAAELKAEKWADFMAVSQGYLDGTTEVA